MQPEIYYFARRYKCCKPFAIRIARMDIVLNRFLGRRVDIKANSLKYVTLALQRNLRQRGNQTCRDNLESSGVNFLTVSSCQAGARQTLVQLELLLVLACMQHSRPTNLHKDMFKQPMTCALFLMLRRTPLDHELFASSAVQKHLCGGRQGNTTSLDFSLEAAFPFVFVSRLFFQQK
jgi:hypothetical protein